MVPPHLPRVRSANVTTAPAHQGGRALPGPLRGCSGHSTRNLERKKADEPTEEAPAVLKAPIGRDASRADSPESRQEIGQPGAPYSAARLEAMRPSNAAPIFLFRAWARAI